MLRWLALTVVLLAPASAAAEEAAGADSLAKSVQELRDCIGRWAVVTEFMRPDGTVARSLDGTYTFEWVMEDRIVKGMSAIPDLGGASGLLFWVDESAGTIVMASVGADGKLWVMTGPAGGDTRYTEPYEAADGTERQLRFTRYNHTPDRFESRMEYTSDGGKTWIQGNHQVFERIQ